MKSWFPHGFCFVLVNGTKFSFGSLLPRFVQYQWIVTLKADVQEEEIWKKKIIGGGGRWGGWDGLLDFFFENVLWILLNWGMNWQKKIYFLICTLREYVPSEYFPASSENPCPTTLYLWEDWNVLNNVYFLKFWSSFAGGSQGFC